MTDFDQDVQAIGRIAAVPTILDVVCRTTGMGFSAVARVTEERWITCKALDKIDFGLEPGDELQLETTLCNEIREHHQPIVIDDVDTHELYCSHHTPARYGFKSYISVPIIRRGGKFFGTLCAIDPVPRKLENTETLGMLQLFAELIAAHLDADEKLIAAEQNLAEERKLAELREQFIAVLGHDLRNPLASISAGAEMLFNGATDERQRRLVKMMRGSIERMSGLIDNLLDFARGRLGGGIALSRNSETELKPLLQQVVEEVQVAHPEAEIRCDLSISDPVDCDGGRLAQLLSNLLSNAVAHGSADEPVEVEASREGSSFVLAVRNRGEPIEPSIKDNLFEPFFRVSTGPSRNGLGLGLYIAAEIAKAHEGSLTVRSDEEGTEFRFVMEEIRPG